MVVDFHSDLLVELAFRNGEQDPFGAHWLRPLRKGSIAVQVCAVATQFESLPDAALRHACEQIVAYYRAIRDRPADVMAIVNRDDLNGVERDGRIGLVLALQGVDPLGYNPELADIFWALGCRIIAPSWIRRNAFADAVSEAPTGGLSRLGVQLVKRLAQLGAIIDLAHANDKTFEDVLDVSAEAPVFVSHAGCRKVCETARNLSDLQLRRVAERGGVVGIMCAPTSIDKANPTVERVADHLAHAVEVAGVSHVGLGGDFGRQIARSGAVRKPPDSLRPAGVGLDYHIPGLGGPEDYARLTEALQVRGFDDEAIEAIQYGNAMRFLKRSLPAGR